MLYSCWNPCNVLVPLFLLFHIRLLLPQPVRSLQLHNRGLNADTVFADFKRTSAPGVRLLNNTVATLLRTSFRRNIVPFTNIPEWAGIFGSAAAVYSGAMLWLQVRMQRFYSPSFSAFAISACVWRNAYMHSWEEEPSGRHSGIPMSRK